MSILHDIYNFFLTVNPLWFAGFWIIFGLGMTWRNSRKKAEQNDKKSKRPRDPAQLAKLIVDIATGEVEDREPTPEEQGKDPAAVSLGRRGGLKGGKERSAKMAPSERTALARKAAGATTFSSRTATCAFRTSIFAGNSCKRFQTGMRSSALRMSSRMPMSASPIV
jgi:hypothetical protein